MRAVSVVGRVGSARPASIAAGLAVAAPAVAVGVGGWFHRWVADDAYIDFRVIGNLVSGHGPVYNVGERVEAYTDPLWVAILSVFRLVAGPAALPWCAVGLGLACTVGGFALGGRAAQRLGRWQGSGLVVPVGLLALGALDATWDFATSGLETGAAFGWEGLSFWLLVRAAEKGHGALLPAFVFGLGVLIRPDLALVAIPLLVALGVVVCSPKWTGPRNWWRGGALPLVVAGALPVAYELFRMAYFALLVPNTALAKSAGAADWSEGFAYLTDLANPAWLWIPLAGAGLAAAVHGWRLRQTSGAVGVAIIAATVAGGLLDWLYVVRLGGDFMHARMLMPGLFLFALVLFCRLWGRLETAIFTVCALWALTIVTAYRYPIHDGFLVNGSPIDNERMFWMAVTRNPHPVSLGDYADSLLDPFGYTARQAVAGSPPPGSGTLPVRVVVPVGAMGVIGVIAGPQVYIFDLFSLANPIGGHFPVTHRGRPGHEKTVPVVWMYGRFVPPGTPLPPGVDPIQVADARAALACGPLSSYLDAITKPLSVGRALTNIGDAFSFTTLRFSSDPAVARQQLCH